MTEPARPSAGLTQQHLTKAQHHQVLCKLHTVRLRFWLESAASLLGGVLTIVTIFVHDWLEVMLGVHPDKGNGSAEWLLVMILLCITIASTIVARIEWRRLATSTD